MGEQQPSVGSVRLAKKRDELRMAKGAMFEEKRRLKKNQKRKQANSHESSYTGGAFE